jgi:hypothetical protein
MESVAQNQPQSELPNSLKYARLPKKAVAGVSNLRRFASTNGGEFEPTNNSIIHIDITSSGVNSFLDSAHGYLQFKISAQGVKATNNIQTIDGGIWSIIDRLRIIDKGSGAILSDIQNYNLLHSMLFKYQTDSSKLATTNAVSGTPPNMRGDNADPTNAGYREAYKVEDSVKFADNTAGSDMTLCMPIINGLLSNTKGLYLPLGASQGLRIEIQLAQAAACMSAAVDVGYKVKSAHYFAPIVNVNGDDFASSMGQMMSAMGGISFTGSDYSGYVSNLAVGAGEKVIDIPVQARSLRALYTISRTAIEVSNIANFGLNEYQTNTITEYNYRVGDLSLPPSRVQCGISAATDARNTSNAYSQVLMATGQLNSIHAQTLVNSTTFNGRDFIHAIDTEAYLNESGNVSHTGIDTLSGNLQVQLEVNNTIAAAQRIDTFALSERLYFLNNNGTFSVSK